jgi:MFS family permease
MRVKVPDVYRSANFRRLWFSSVVSKAGSNLTEIALAVFAFRVSGGQPEAYAGALALDLVPALVLGWAVGGVVDRWHRRRTMVAGDLVRGLLVASVPVVGHLWWAYAVVFANKSITLIYTPNQRALLPETVGPGQVMQANAAIGAGTNLIDVPAYLLGVGLLLRAGLLPTFLGDGASYWLAGFALLGLALPHAVLRPTAQEASSFRRTVAEGVRYHQEHRLVRTFLWLAVMAGAGVEGFNVLSATLVRYRLHLPEGNLGWLLAALSFGSWLGATLLGQRLEQRRHYPAVIAAGFALVSASCLGLAVSWSLTADLLLFVVAGLGAAGFLYPTASWIQSIVPSQMRGRVYAARGIVIGVMGTISVLGAGAIAQTAGVGWALCSLATVLLAASAASWSTLSRAARLEAAATVPDPAPESAES